VAFFELLQFFYALLDKLWVVYMWHRRIVPSKTGNGISFQLFGEQRRARLETKLSYGCRAVSSDGVASYYPNN